MRYPILCLSLALLVGAGCSNGKNDRNDTASYTLPQESTTHSRPIVALVPMADHTVNDLSWNLSEELTSTIHYRLMQQEKLYLIEPAKVVSTTKKLSKSQHPFGNDLSWVKKAFSGNEFVVFMELTQHEELPIKSQKTTSEYTSAELNMSVRVRVIDLRGTDPQIVLQELVHDTHHIPKQFTKAHFHQVPWGEGCYSISPLGLAHAKLSKEIALRVEDYILLAAQAKKQ